MNALAVWAEEGRGVTAKLVGEVSSNLRSGGVRMGKPDPSGSLETENVVFGWHIGVKGVSA
jgi:hypothetical protein